jgi:hypothetical protein
MRYLTSFTFFLSVLALTGACTEQVCETGGRIDDQCIEGNAGQVHALVFSQPSDIGAMIEWSGDGVQGTDRDVLLFAAYEEPPGEMRIYGGTGSNVEGTTSILDVDRAFDVRAYRSNLGTYTDPFQLEIPLGDGTMLTITDAVMHDVNLDYSPGTPVPTEGLITGVLTAETALSTDVSRLGMSVLEYLDGSGAAPDFDMDGDGTHESWVLSVAFTTTLSWML